MNVLLINTSTDEYNLGLAKAANYWRSTRRASVSYAQSVPTLFPHTFDVVWISAIFSWDVPALITHAQDALALGKEVAVGGPGTFGVQKQIQAATGLKPQSTPDPRFERQPGTYQAVFWSRGCPAKNCTLGFPRKPGEQPICSVPAMEGWRYTLYTDVSPAPVIMDNNLSALPRGHQDLIIRKTLEANFPVVDANSGFEPRSFRPETAERWKQLPLKAWRFAYDERTERPAVLRMMKILDDAGVSRKSRHIYCLAGNEPLDECLSRVSEIVQWGALPYVQRRRPLNYMAGPLPVLYDWTEQTLIDFQRWGNRFSGGIPFSEYRRGLKDRHDQLQTSLKYHA